MGGGCLWVGEGECVCGGGGEQMTRVLWTGQSFTRHKHTEEEMVNKWKTFGDEVVKGIGHLTLGIRI